MEGLSEIAHNRSEPGIFHNEKRGLNYSEETTCAAYSILGGLSNLSSTSGRTAYETNVDSGYD